MTDEQYNEISKIRNERDRLQNAVKKLDYILNTGQIAQMDGKYYLTNINYDYPSEHECGSNLSLDREEVEVLKSCLSKELADAKEQFEAL